MRGAVRTMRGRPINEATRRAVVRAAFQEIASVGFEGLRIRRVAEVAGVHHATLLHHFPSKEALVQGVLDQLEADFRTPEEPHEVALDPVDRLRHEFEDGYRRLHDDPETFAVLLELALRARHHPAVRSMVDSMFGRWRSHVAEIFAGGQPNRFRANLDPRLAAHTVMLTLKGAALDVLAGDSADTGAALQMASDQVISWALSRT
jgi:AcrR family transcriptional regulator